MSTDRLVRVMAAQIAVFERDPHPHLLAQVCPDDVRVWHFFAGGLAEPYAAGEYLFRLTAPDSFPEKPPRFEFLTPCGLYQPGGPICISVGEWHAGDAPGADGAHGWRPSLGMRGFAEQVVNGLICHEELGHGPASGIRILDLPAPMKRMLALASRGSNAREWPALAAAFEARLAAAPDTALARGVLAARRAAGGAAPAAPLSAPAERDGEACLRIARAPARWQPAPDGGLTTVLRPGAPGGPPIAVAAAAAAAAAPPRRPDALPPHFDDGRDKRAPPHDSNVATVLRPGAPGAPPVAVAAPAAPAAPREEPARAALAPASAVPAALAAEARRPAPPARAAPAPPPALAPPSTPAPPPALAPAAGELEDLLDALAGVCARGAAQRAAGPSGPPSPPPPPCGRSPPPSGPAARPASPRPDERGWRAASPPEDREAGALSPERAPSEDREAGALSPERAPSEDREAGALSPEHAASPSEDERAPSEDERAASPSEDERAPPEDDLPLSDEEREPASSADELVLASLSGPAAFAAGAPAGAFDDIFDALL